MEPGYHLSSEFGWCAVSNLTWVMVDADGFPERQEIVGKRFDLAHQTQALCLDMISLSEEQRADPAFIQGLALQAMADHSEGLALYIVKDIVDEESVFASGVYRSPLPGMPVSMLPPPITVSVDSDHALNISLPSMNMFLSVCDVDRGFMDDCFLTVCDWVRECACVSPDTEVDLHPYADGLPHFRVEEGVMMENLIEHPLSIDTLNAGIWASNSEFIEYMNEHFQQGVETFIAWLEAYNLNAVYYHTMVSRHSGNYVIYTFAGFTCGQKKVEFQINIFDHEGFDYWFSQMQEKSPWPFFHAKSLEFDWGIEIASSHCLRLSTPVAPGCKPTMVILPCEEAVVGEDVSTLPAPIDALARCEVWLPREHRHVASELISAGAEAWLFPAMMFPQDKRDMFAVLTQILTEAAEEGISFFPDMSVPPASLARRLAFELSLRHNPTMVPEYGMILLTSIPQDDFGDLCLHGVIPHGELDATCEKAIQSHFPTQHIAGVSALPQFNETVVSLGLEGVDDPAEEDCE